MLLDAQWKHATDKDYEIKRKQLAADANDNKMVNTLERINEVIDVSHIKICSSAAGFYIGRMASVSYSEQSVPWDRVSDYFDTEIVAYEQLKYHSKRQFVEKPQ